jgi:hypothetical protein
MGNSTNYLGKIQLVVNGSKSAQNCRRFFGSIQQNRENPAGYLSNYISTAAKIHQRLLVGRKLPV